MISFLSPGPPGYSKCTSFALRTTLQNVPNIVKRILMSDPLSPVDVFGQTGPISLEQPDLRGTDTFVYPAWMLCFGNFAGLGHQQHNMALAVSSSPFYPPLWERFWHQSDVRGCCHVRFKYYFWGQNGSTLKACKIVTFNARRLKLWNSVFDKVHFKTKQKQISLHRHFKRTYL